MNHRVTLTEAAIEDLHVLHRKDPQILRHVIKKILLLERSAFAGEPLRGALVGFRKLTVGNRTWRIIWRVITETNGTLSVDIAEVWAAGAREESAVYTEITSRIKSLSTDPKTLPLTDALAGLADLMDKAPPLSTTEIAAPPILTLWISEALRDQLGYTDSQLIGLTDDDGKRLLMAKWTNPS